LVFVYFQVREPPNFSIFNYGNPPQHSDSHPCTPGVRNAII
jgi:hypothetical protein